MTTDFMFVDGFRNDLISYQIALEKTLAVPSYKKFLEITSPYQPIVVINNSADFADNDKAQCHENCRLAELEGRGKLVSGWYLMNEFIFSEYQSGCLRLVHHSNLLQEDGTLLNPTCDGNRTHQIFLRDDKRIFDFENQIGYNDRMVFGDGFMVGRDYIKAVPRNKVLFGADSKYDRDLMYEKFTVHQTREDVMKAMPVGLTKEKAERWLIFKSSARFHH